VNDEAQPIEERLRRRLVNMIQGSQGHIFSSYRSRHTSGASMFPPQGRGRSADVAINSCSPAPPESVNSNIGGVNLASTISGARKAEKKHLVVGQDQVWSATENSGTI
jgi:hypothetical protein